MINSTGHFIFSKIAMATGRFPNCNRSAGAFYTGTLPKCCQGHWSLDRCARQVYISPPQRQVMDKNYALVVFEDKKIRRTWFIDEWHFSIIDVVGALTNSENPRNYWNMLKAREAEQGIELYTFCVRLKLLAEDGKQRETDCANTKNMFRIIQSIPSPKAEPFKQWLAQVGYDRVQEIENPELAQKRMKELYRAKGYSDEWIEKRVRGIAIRDELTDEWKKRDVGTEKEYAILTAEISKATFGMTPSEYKKIQRIEKRKPQGPYG